jgi:hypothetical protein
MQGKNGFRFSEDASMNPVPNTMTSGTPSNADRWWIVALVAALTAVLQFLLVWFLPTWLGTWAFAVGLVAYAMVMWRNPTYWYRRTSAAAFGFAGLSAAIPSINAQLHFASTGTALLIIENASYVSPAFIATGILLAWFDYKSLHPQQVLGATSTTVHQPDNTGIAIGHVSGGKITIGETPELKTAEGYGKPHRAMR